LHARRLLLFRAAGRLCACDLEVVREIAPGRASTRLPGAPDWVVGLVNLRGTLVTVVDLSRRFGAESGKARQIIIVEACGKVFGLGVDEVKDVKAIADEAIEPVDVQRSVGGIVLALAHLGAEGDGTAMVCDVVAIAREALAV
jgi:purine-binding chemotaxis protein CheW